MAKKLQIFQMLKRAAVTITSKPATIEYPFIKLPPPPNIRGQPTLDTALCVGCGLCSRDCPSKAIEMVQVGPRKYPQFNIAKCLFCHQCIESCRKKAIKNSREFELATTDKSSLIIKPRVLIPA
jgi:formate hydrogenlyase subunit 6/NADH:ubiquinone oxidoreductase subunit I